MQSNRLDRRQFIRVSSLAALASAALPTLVPSRAFGANDRLRGAVFGVGPQGTYHMESYSKEEGVEIVGLADPDQKRLESAQAKLKDKYGVEAKIAQDSRKILEDQSIDFVSVASCNHWHSLLGIWAAQAGKHVYVEKPCSQTLFDGLKLAEAAAKYKVCIQHGTQRRHDAAIKRGATAWATGKYGKPIALRTFANRTRGPVLQFPIEAAPESLDWNTWVGPAAMVDYCRCYIPYNWHWFWNFGNGEIGNNGVHYFDQSRIALGLLKPGIKHPQNVCMFGARFVDDKARNYQDQAQTPTIQLGIYDFDGIPMIFQSCNLRKKESKWLPRETAYFVTEDGYIDHDTFVGNDGSREKIGELDGYVAPFAGGQFSNFLNCVRDNAPEKLNAPIAEGQYSAAVCHLGNISYRLGKSASLADCRKAVGDNAIMQTTIDETLDNVKSYFGDAVNIEKDIPWVCGEKISINNETNQFDDNPAANALLTRPERAPFVVPETV